jgi:hypothetical protein
VDAGDCSGNVISLGSGTSAVINAQADFPDISTVAVTAQTITSGTPKRIRLTLSFNSNNKEAYMDAHYNNSTADYDSNLQPATLIVPENVVIFALLSSLIPFLVNKWMRKKKEKLELAL